MAGEWNSDMSAAPRDGTVLLAIVRVVGADAYALIHWQDGGKGGRGWYDGLDLPDRWPRLWMPLPPAPTGDA